MLHALESSISTFQFALKLTSSDDPELPQRLGNLAASFGTLFNRYGKPENLESAIDAGRRAVELTPSDDADLPWQLRNLAVSLRIRFDRFGQPEDLEAALDADRSAVELTPSDDPELPRRLGSLAISLGTRFYCFREPEDLESALNAGRGAVELTPSDDPEISRRLGNLAISLRIRFKCFGQLEDLESALDAERRAVELSPSDDPELPQRSSNLAESLRIRFYHFFQLEDLENALDADRRAVRFTHVDDPGLPRRLGSLAASLRTRFNCFGEPEDLERALDAYRRAIELTPEGHPDKLRRMQELGSCLDSRLSLDRTQKNFNEVSECYLAALYQPIGYPGRLFQSAEAYMRTITKYPEFLAPDSLLSAHSHIMDSLSELVWLGHSVQRRFEESARVGGLVNAAVSVAIESGDLARAVGWLEAGRGLIWSQFASMRTPLDDLAEQLPDIAHDLHDVHMKLQELAAQMDTLDSSSRDIGVAQGHVYVDSAADRYRRVAIRHDTLVKAIRSRDGFENFIRPTSLADFIASPVFARLNEPVVCINIAKSSCGALILLASGTVKLVELPGLSQKRADKLRDLWTNNIGMSRAHRRGAPSRAAALMRGCSNVYTHVLSTLR